MVQNLNNGVAAQEYDIVAFFSNKAKKGNSSISASHNNAKYYFSSEANKETFLKEPNKYTPEYGGFCSIAMSEGAQANPNPKSFLIQDGKLYFFTMMFFGIIDAKRQWVKKPDELRKLADDEYAKMS